MDEINDGGQAFPLDGHPTKQEGKPVRHPGMSLRDYFAAHAMAAIIADWSAQATRQANAEGQHSEMRIAELSYEFADAMLLARVERLKGCPEVSA